MQHALREQAALTPREPSLGSASAPEQTHQRVAITAWARNNFGHRGLIGREAKAVSPILSRPAFVVASSPGWPVRYTATSRQVASACESPKLA